jgi:tetratricopeptide (TPR) repeat protein
MSVGFRQACAWVIVIAPFLLAGTFEVRAAGDDAKLCAKESGDAAIEACSRAIKSGRYRGPGLARQYPYRGVERGLKQEYDLALADYGEAAKIDKKYADAFYNRCVIFNLKKDYDSAITDCSQAIKLGPTPKATLAAGGEQLGNDRTISDYYAERGLAYFQERRLHSCFGRFRQRHPHESKEWQGAQKPGARLSGQGRRARRCRS